MSHRKVPVTEGKTNMGGSYASGRAARKKLRATTTTTTTPTSFQEILRAAKKGGVANLT